MFNTSLEHIAKARAQVTIEYLLLLAGIILAVLAFLNKSHIRENNEKLYDTSAAALQKMVGK